MGVKFPFGTGKIVEDLSPELEVKQKQLYIIYFDDSSPRDFRGHIRVYGAFWSAGPGAVNKVAVSLWSKFGVGTKIKPTSYDYEPLSNIDGRHTKEGECYAGFMRIPLAINVLKVVVGDNCWLGKIYHMKLLERCLEVVGINVGGSSIPIKVKDDFLKGKVFVLAGVFEEVSEEEKKSNSLVTKMLESAGATVYVRMTKKTNYLLAGKGSGDVLYMIEKATKKNIPVVNLSTIHKLLLGEISLDDFDRKTSLTEECYKNAYEAATTIPKNLMEAPSDMEKAIDELNIWPPHRRDKKILKPLIDLFGWHDWDDFERENKIKPSNSNNNVDEEESRKKQKTGE